MNKLTNIENQKEKHKLTARKTTTDHDSDFNLSRTAIYSREKAYPNSLTGNMVQTNDSGVTNYYLPVYAYGTSVTADTVPALLLWFFDSRGG